MRLRVDPARANADFVYYALSTRKAIERLIRGSEHTGVPKINLAYIRQFEIPLPPLPVQTAIADVVIALDDRIDLLRQTNTTLEAIAQALFKSWFVEFDPVHAKAEGRDPEAMALATAALFPGEFEDSELGLIPKGWRAGQLGDVSSNIRDQARPGKIDPDTPYFGLEHMPRKSIALGDHGTADGLGSGKFWFEESDILFGKLRPYFHKVGLAPFKGICSTDILVLRPLQPAFHAFFLMHASSNALIDYATRLSNGAKMPRSSWKDIANYPICIPPDSVVQAFNETVDPMLRRIKANVETASTLAKLRDTLLPRLISGKLRLPEATEAVEAAPA
jgi:type I restriction enzyme S subunit